MYFLIDKERRKIKAIEGFKVNYKLKLNITEMHIDLMTFIWYYANVTLVDCVRSSKPLGEGFERMSNF